MKKIIATLILVVTAISSYGQIYLEDIDKGWPTKTISNVANGSIGVLLESFDKTWPTWMGKTIRNTMEKGLSKEVLDEETELTVIVDATNGYASLGDAGTDDSYMNACVWNRDNGHKLLAVCLGKPTDPCIEIVCFYDYNPQKKTLTPEPDILKGYRWNDKGEFPQIYCRLPRKGKDITIDDWCGNSPVRHTFTWNGMKPVYSKSEPINDDEELEPTNDITVKFKGTSPNIKDFMTAFIKHPFIMEPVMGMEPSWELFLNGMKLMPGESLTVDVQNGYVNYESIESDNERLVIQCCYWNCADKKHKIVALSNDSYKNGKAITGHFSGVDFYTYDNDTHIMQMISPCDLGIEFDAVPGVYATTHSLPRQGKTIVFTFHTTTGKKEKRVTWNGNKFM